MQRANQIKAYFLLAIFSLILIHQSIPHCHDDHESDIKIAHHHSDSSHGHGHSHNNEHQHNHSDNSNKKEAKSLLNTFLEFHTHGNTYSQDNLISTFNLIKKDVSSDNKSCCSKENLNYNLDISLSKDNNYNFYTPPDVFYESYLEGIELRGPPVLG
ncbi:hypothetical protein EV195_103214 [Tenacibaculum skagerrakense]|uniref:Uncharacterized protein n=1 Tax=Tenacibaculum skagerrakense TaxID=186571 RepID=A0A4R2NV58_9FLAO|nr:hypothetical protein [Tenacibaculum skagerrakense]TCP25852.1 hypothetical protein EV195_103214 [Tenacibaculum skagerrakense]